MSEFDRYAMLSFDCYGTLIDWESGIAAALGRWARASGWDASDEDLISAHAAHETVAQQALPTAPYPVILAETMRRIGAERGLAVRESDAAAYGASVGDWPAFGDTPAALRRLGTRFKLVILSNIDRATFALSKPHLGVEFDAVITAEDVGSYKPAPAHFETLLAAATELVGSAGSLLHVAESMYHDLVPAADFGIPSVWIHRRHDKGGYGATATPQRSVTPQWTYPSLEAFADAALSGG